MFNSTDWKIMSSYEGKILDLLVTLPPSPDEFVNQYYQQIEDHFKDRPRLIRFRNYHPPRPPYLGSDPEAKPQSHPVHELAIPFKGREVFEYTGDGTFFQAYLGDLIEHLQRGSRVENTEWAQDPFAVLQNTKGGSAFLQPLFAGRAVDKFISLQLSAWPDLDMLVQPTQLLLEGGNLLAGRNFALIGKDTLAHNILHRLHFQPGKAGQLKEEIELDFSQALGVDHIIWVGFERSQQNWKGRGLDTFQPEFHLDVFLCLGGTLPSGEQLVFLGDPELTWQILATCSACRSSRVQAKAVAQYHEIKSFFEHYNQNRKGNQPCFKVVSIPQFIFQEVVMSFTNGLIESYAGHRIAYLPDYETSAQEDKYEKLNPSIQVLKTVIEERFYQFGFTRVCWIGPGTFFRKLSQLRGSLHCITKVLRRSPV